MNLFLLIMGLLILFDLVSIFALFHDVTRLEEKISRLEEQLNDRQ